MVVLFWFVSFAHAMAAAEYSVVPLVIDVEARGRDVVSKQITIRNTGTQPLTLYATVNNISLTDQGSVEEFLPPSMSDRTTSLASWIEISRAGIDVPVNASTTVDLTIRLHPQPVPGTYHALIGFGYGRNRDEAEAQVRRGAAPGIVVTVTIPEDKKTSLKLGRFTIDRFITSARNQAAVFTVFNNGDVPIVPTGDIIIYDAKGREVGALTVNADATPIPPGAEYQFIDSIPTKGMFGKYKAYLSVEYGTSQMASLQDTVFFYVLPYRDILIAFSVLAVLVILLGLWIHHRYFSDSPHFETDYLPLHVRTHHTAEPHARDIDLTPKP